MNRIIYTLSACVLFVNLIACSMVPVSKADFNWLVGDWIRSNEKPDRATYESWRKESNSVYLGTSYTILNKDTIWQENVRLNKKGSDWYYDVYGTGANQPTSFKLTALAANSFTCENQQNEFPKKIAYSKNGEAMDAVISGGGPEILFNFQRIQK